MTKAQYERLLHLLRSYSTDDKLLEFLGLILINHQDEGNGEDRYNFLYDLVKKSYYKKNEVKK